MTNKAECLKKTKLLNIFHSITAMAYLLGLIAGIAMERLFSEITHNYIFIVLITAALIYTIVEEHRAETKLGNEEVI